jgi:hypothetical protein
MKEIAMRAEIFSSALVALALLVVVPTAVDGYGAARVGKTYVGPAGGVHHAKKTVVSGPGGVHVGGKSTSIGPYGGVHKSGYGYGAGYGGAYGGAYSTGSPGYHYSPSHYNKSYSYGW